MPYISTHVSTPLPKTREERIKEALGRAIQLIPGKSEAWLMTEFQDHCRLYFRGKDDVPTAFVEVKAYGSLEAASAEALTAAICEILKAELGIAPDHVYVKYEACQLWGWNGGNF